VVLVDTSVWVAHLREGHADLIGLLNDNYVACHPFIIGELACGSLKNRKEILSLLNALPATKVAEHDEVMQFIDDHKLMNRGLGYVDVHLLASAMLSGVSIWTFDKKLDQVCSELGTDFMNEERR